MASRDIWVLVDHRQGELREVTKEMLGEAKDLAGTLGTKACAIVLGQDVEALVKPLARFGADIVHLVEHPLLADYTTDAYAEALTALMESANPLLVILPSTPDGDDLAPRVATRLQAALVTRCTMLKADSQGRITITKPACDDKVYLSIDYGSEARYYMATMRPGCRGVDKPDFQREAEVRRWEVKITPESIRTRIVGSIKGSAKTVNLSEADIVVCGGIGVGSAAEWHLVEELAEVLDGGVGATRKVTDEGWVPRDRLVGQTGAVVRPRLYIGVGVSGAAQHVAGMRQSERIVAINKDRAAPLCKLSELSAVGDLREILPIMIAKLRQIKGDNGGRGN